ncbi:unnamed protein product [Prunus armeniaca]|uniref:Uncharacterized protein n=1 Tax=Prunus armeniaca TaxID=36596 RepID=A0A6J5TW61_PRUAR|nr:unnamed protein product [Prunus armeniaca]CAB4298691.1 unnamed protein product [Prunus armeniaca]
MEGKEILECTPPDLLLIDLINYKSKAYLHKLQAGNRMKKMRKPPMPKGSKDASLCHATYVKNMRQIQIFQASLSVSSRCNNCKAIYNGKPLVWKWHAKKPCK